MAVIVLNPSCQYGNVVMVADKEVYNEGLNLFDIAAVTKTALEKLGHQVYLTRDYRDEPSDLEREMLKANAYKPDLMVALHSDAAGPNSKPDVGGTSTFYASKRGKNLSNCIHPKLCKAIKTIYPDHVDRGVRTHWHKLYVLHNINAPACLIEILFHTNSRERKLLQNRDFHLLVAQAIASGINDYLKLAIHNKKKII